MKIYITIFAFSGSMLRRLALLLHLSTCAVFTQILTIFLNFSDKFVVDSESDMLMEPDEHNPDVNAYAIETRVVYSTSSTRPSGFRPIVPMARQEFIDQPEAAPLVQEEHSTLRAENTPAEQNFFPFYRSSPPLGHSRPYYQPPAATEQFATERYSHVPRSQSARSAFDQTILG